LVDFLSGEVTYWPQISRETGEVGIMREDHMAVGGQTGVGFQNYRADLECGGK
jgi:hypothetical protein